MNNMLSIAAVDNTIPDCAAQPQTALCVVECFGGGMLWFSRL